MKELFMKIEIMRVNSSREMKIKMSKFWDRSKNNLKEVNTD